MKILVTGGAGFIGSNLVDLLVANNHEVTVVDNFSTGKRENLAHLKDKIKIINYDLCYDPPTFAQLGEQEVVVHLAALARMQRSIDSPLETHMANVTGTLNILEFARKTNVKKFIYASSSSVYGDQKEMPLIEFYQPNPMNPYAAQKLMGELYCDVYYKVYGLPTISLRFFNVYGKRMDLTGDYKLIFGYWINQIKAKQPITINGDGEQTRDFTHVSDICNGVYSVITGGMPKIHMAINLCGGKQTSINKLASLFEHKTIHVPARPNEEKYKQGNSLVAQTLFGYEPKVSIEQGIKEMRSYYGI